MSADSGGWLDPRHEQDLLRGLLRANHDRPGIKALALFRVQADFLADLRSEILHLVEAERASLPSMPDHKTNWTKPYGGVRHFSLLNETGRYEDTSRDHDRSRVGKKFHDAAQYPTLARFIALFPDAYNMRLNLLEESSGLAPHKESLVLQAPGGRHRIHLRARFHLPIITHAKALLLLDKELFHFQEGVIHFFNNGCVHAAENGAPERRLHLVWDMVLTRRGLARMFGVGQAPEGLVRLRGDEQIVPSVRPRRVDAYAPSGPAKWLHIRLGLHRLGIADHRLQDLYTPFAYFGNRYLRRLAPAPISLLDTPPQARRTPGISEYGDRKD